MSEETSKKPDGYYNQRAAAALVGLFAVSFVVAYSARKGTEAALSAYGFATPAEWAAYNAGGTYPSVAS